VRVFHDQDADLSILEGKEMAVIGYGNQGRAQAQNLRDSGLSVAIGNREDGYAEQARTDGFPVLSIGQATAAADIVMLLIPDEVAPGVFENEIAPHLGSGNTLVFASGYNIAFELIVPSPLVDVVLVAPRMIGAGVRELYVAGRGFPSFIGVAQDRSGRAKETALALAAGIGSTRAGVVEVSFAQETELDLFTEQCFGPAFGHVLTTAVDLLLEEGYPPEAVLLELYMSGELSYTLGKIAELGMVEQTKLHSPTSQYGSMTRGMRFILPDLRTKMAKGLEEIRSGRFADEWATEQAAGRPTLTTLQETARSLPLHRLEQQLLLAMRGVPESQQTGREGLVGSDSWQPTAFAVAIPETVAPAPQAESQGEHVGLFGKALAAARRLGVSPSATSSMGAPDRTQMEEVLRRFLADAAGDPALREFSRGRQMTTHYALHQPDLEFHLSFADGEVTGGLGPPPAPAEVRLETKAETLDGMFSGRMNAIRAAMTGKLSFSGDTKLAISIQQIQDDLKRLYMKASRR
jgi:ketol-acid reductoisomerase